MPDSTLHLPVLQIGSGLFAVLVGEEQQQRRQESNIILMMKNVLLMCYRLRMFNFSLGSVWVPGIGIRASTPNYHFRQTRVVEVMVVVMGTRQH